MAPAATSPAAGVTHFDLQTGLAAMLRTRKPRPIVASEIAIAGDHGSEGRLDVIALVIGTAYRTARLEGFEVKANRADWLREQASEKWSRYLPWLDRFYLAVPEDVRVVDADELPASCGLMIRRAEGNVWRVARKAPKLVPDQRDERTWLRMLRRMDDELVRALDPPESRSDRLRRLAAAVEDRHLAATLSERFSNAQLELDLRTRGLDNEIRDLERYRDALRLEVDELTDASGVLEDAGDLLRLVHDALRPLGTYRPEDAVTRRRQVRSRLRAIAARAD